MKVGTKSLLFGVHNFIWHPITVVRAWIELYHEFPEPGLLFCIVIHDWGYWGRPNMDGKEGASHPYLGYKIAKKLLDTYYARMCLYHSRHIARAEGREPSLLCWADKLSICYDPIPFYLFRARLSGELKEYRREADKNGFYPLDGSDREWLIKIRGYFREQAYNRKSSTQYMRKGEYNRDEGDGIRREKNRTHERTPSRRRARNDPRRG